MDLDKLFIVDPDDIKGISITGQPSDFRYKNHTDDFREALKDIDYVFASIIQVNKKGAIENGFPTLAVAFDDTKVDSFEKYMEFVSEISSRLSETTKSLDLPLNLLVLDRRDKYLNHFKTSTSWLIGVKKYPLYNTYDKPWWKFW